MGVFEAIKKGFVSVTKNFKLWLLVVIISFAIAIISSIVLVATIGPDAFQPQAQPVPLTDLMAKMNKGVFAVFAVLMALLQAFVISGVIGSIKDIVKTNRFVVKDFLGNAKKFFLRFLLFIIILVAALVLLNIIFELMVRFVEWLTGIANILGLLVGIVVSIANIAVSVLIAVYISFCPAAIVAGDKGTVASLVTAFNFIKGKLWKAVGLVISLLIIFIAVLTVNNRVILMTGPFAFIVQLAVSIITIYLLLGYNAGIMAFYLGNSGTAAPSSPETI